MPKISRRDFIQLGAATLAILALPKEESVPIAEPTPAEQAYAKALEMIPGLSPEQRTRAMFEQLEKRQRAMLEFTEKVLKTGGDVWPTPPVFTSKDCEQAGQAMMDGFMQGIKATIPAEDIEKLAKSREVTK